MVGMDEIHPTTEDGWLSFMVLVTASPPSPNANRLGQIPVQLLDADASSAEKSGSLNRRRPETKSTRLWIVSAICI
jgi:hypothetical protein